MQPVEVIELIHQLAANVGCHIHIKPRDDFSSWREWKIIESEKDKLSGFPPFANGFSESQNVGAVLPPSENQPGLKIDINKRSAKNDKIVAAKKTINKRNIKRASKAT
jgi:hypothetical protein